MAIHPTSTPLLQIIENPQRATDNALDAPVYLVFTSVQDSCKIQTASKVPIPPSQNWNSVCDQVFPFKFTLNLGPRFFCGLESVLPSDSEAGPNDGVPAGKASEAPVSQLVWIAPSGVVNGLVPLGVVVWNVGEV